MQAWLASGYQLLGDASCSACLRATIQAQEGERSQRGAITQCPQMLMAGDTHTQDQRQRHGWWAGLEVQAAWSRARAER